MMRRPRRIGKLVRKKKPRRIGKLMRLKSRGDGNGRAG